MHKLHDWGLLGTYNFLYMPTGTPGPDGGLAVVNFIDANFASLCKSILNGNHWKGGTASDAPVQGLENNMALFAGVKNAAHMPLLIPSPTASQSALECRTAMPKAWQSPGTFDIREQFRKTKMCKFHRTHSCTQGKYCPYAHDAAEVQAPPNLLKTKLCHFCFQGLCVDSMCRFAHGYGELRSTETVYKTEVCRQWLQGRCKFGHACIYAHGVEELRGPKAVASRSQGQVFQSGHQDVGASSVKPCPPPASHRSYSAARRWLDGGGDEEGTPSTLSMDAV